MKKRLLSLALCLALCLGLLPVGVLATDGKSGGIYVPSGPTEGGGGTYTPPEDTRTEIWRNTSLSQSISRSYDGTTDGSTIKVTFPFTDGSKEIQLEEGKDCEAVKTFDSADAGSRTVTVELKLIGDAATKYKLKEDSEKFTIGGNINKAYPKLTVSLSKTTCAVDEKLLPLLSVDGVQEGAAVTYYYTPIQSGYLEFEDSDAVPKIGENTAISEPGTYYVYAKTARTSNYEEQRSTTVKLTVAEKVDPVASVTTANGTETPYDSFSDAWTAATASAESTLKLLADATLPNTNTDLGQSLTLDLNGYVLGSNGSLTVKSGAALTVTNAGGEKSKNPIKVGLYLNLLVEKGGSFTCTDGKISSLGLLSESTDDYNIKLAEGESHCTFGGFAQGDANATIGDLLKATPGMALYAEDAGSTVQIARSTLISKGFNYFSFYVGACSEHQMDANGTCIYCGASYVASVTTNGGETNDYTSLDDALNAAQNGDTVTLLSDVDLGETCVTISKSITFDLNGKTLSSSKTWSSDGVLLVKDAAVTVKNGTVNATGIGNCAIHAYRSGASMTLEAVTATVTSDKSSVMVGDFGSAVIKSGDYQGLYVGKNSHVTLEGGTFRPYMDNITNKNVKSIFCKVNETTDATSRDCMELLGDGCVYVDENRTQVRTGGGFNTVVTVQKGTAIDAPVAKIGDVEYASLSKAIDAVQNGGTITLLNDLDLGNGAVLQVGSSKKNFTIDLDNHTLSADGACLIMLHNGSQLTLKNGTLDGSRCTSYAGVLFISSNSELTLENVTAKSGSVANLLNVQRSVPLVYVTNGTVVFDGGTYAGGVLLKTDGNAVLKSGTFQKGTNAYSIKTEGSGKHLSDYLDDDSQFWDDNTPLDLSSATETADEVTVRPCKHNWENGKCTVCQKVCDHGSADGKSMTEDPCHTCGMKAAAQVDITGSDAKYFPSFNDALVYATNNNGCTLKLLANVTDPVSINTPFIFDLNGHNFNKLSVGARAKIRDSSTTKGTIKELKVFNIMDADDNEPVLTVADLLEEGYAFKSSSENKWYFGVENAITNVTVQPAPIKSVTAEHPTVTVEYGKTSGVTLTATAVPATEGGTVSYQWYEIGGTDFPIQDATENTYQLPADLGAGTHTYRLTATSDGYPKSVDITVKVTPISLEGATVTVKNLTYNGEKQLPMVTVTLDGKTLKNTDFDVNATMQTNAGSYTLTISGNGNYTGTKTVEWKILPKTIANPTIEVGSGGIYDKTAKTPSVVVKDDGTSIPDSEYTVSYENNTNAGTATVKITDKENGNYTVNCSSTFEIQKAPALILETINVTATAGVAKTITVPLTGLMPEDANISGYVTGTMNGFGLVSGDNVKPHFIYDVTENSKEGTITATVTITSQNYEDSTATVSLTLTPKAIPVGAPTLSKSVLTYGDKLGDITLSGSMMDREAAVEGTFSWVSPEDKPSTTEKYVAKWVFTPKDKNTYATVHGETNITVNKATPTGKPEYTAITTSGKKLSDASLTQTETSFSVPGTVAWKLPADTEVTANTAYEWVFTPNDTDNYNTLTGTITLWHKSSSGSSSGAVTPGTKTDTVKNPDGSTTKTETKVDGSKTETTTASSDGGSTGTTVTKTDAKGNTTTEASAKLSDRDVKEAQEKGKAVTVPVKEIEAAKDANAAAKIKIDVPNNADKTTVEIPVENVTSGTVAVIVHEDGTEELVKDSKPTEGGVQLELSGSTTVKIIDNSKTFDDTKDHWSRDEVNFVAARELFQGVGGNQFGVSQPMTRGMVNTVLARLAGVDTTPGQGQAWYEVGTDWAKKNGISDGTNPTAPVTREQLATLLYRYAGSPSVSGTLHAADAASVSDYAEDALLWANQNGIVNGVGSNTIAPKDNAQRAQVAAMLARYLQNQ